MKEDNQKNLLSRFYLSYHRDIITIFKCINVGKTQRDHAAFQTHLKNYHMQEGLAIFLYL